MLRPIAPLDVNTSVLVTGATGFIGGHLCSYLDAKGYRVRGTFRPGESREGYPAKMSWVRIKDIGSYSEWQESLVGIDYVVHLAALAHRVGKEAQGRFDEYMSVNAIGSQWLARSIADNSEVKRFVFLSSVGAVRTLSAKRLDETSPCEPDTDYGRSKRVAELLIQEELRNSVSDWCIIRPTLVYGPGNPGNMARLLGLVSRGVPLPLGGIKNVRSFLFVGNLVDLIEKILAHPGASRRIFMVSDGEDISTSELILRLAKCVQKRLRLISVPIFLLKVFGHIGDWINGWVGLNIGLDSYSVERLTGSLYVDTRAVRESLGWEPPYSMDAGLSLTLTSP